MPVSAAALAVSKGAKETKEIKSNGVNGTATRLLRSESVSSTFTTTVAAPVFPNEERGRELVRLAETTREDVRFLSCIFFHINCGLQRLTRLVDRVIAPCVEEDQARSGCSADAGCHTGDNENSTDADAYAKTYTDQVANFDRHRRTSSSLSSFQSPSMLGWDTHLLSRTHRKPAKPKRAWKKCTR